MMKQVAHILATKLVNLEFLDLIAGMAQPVADKKPVEGQTSLMVKKIPVSYDIVKRKNFVKGKEIDLVPNAAKMGMVYFEDGTSQTDSGGRADGLGYTGNMRLICWLSKTAMGLERYKELTTPAIIEIIKLLKTGRAMAGTGINTLFVTGYRVIQDESIFQKYNYDAAESAYLRPPYEFFAIDLQVKFRVMPHCLTEITLNNG